MTPGQIKSAAPGTIIRDTQVKGLHIRITPHRRAFYLYYRTKSGKERRPKLGDFPTLTIQKAREAARSILDQVAAGKDPADTWADFKRNPAMRQVCERFLKEHVANKKSQGSYQTAINKYILPKLGHLKATEVTYDRLCALHQSMEGTPVAANRTLAVLSKILNLCERWGYREHGSNPCRFVERYKERPRRRYLTAGEAPRLFAALEAHQEKEPANVAFVWLLILTGARKGEIARTKRENLEGKRLVLKEHKTDGTGEDRIIYLPNYLIRIIKKLPATNGTLTGVKEPKRFWKTICKEANLKDLRLHDLRHSFASTALAAGLDLGLIGELLGHKSAQTTKRYAHLIEDAGSLAVEMTAEKMLDMMKRKGAANAR